MEFIEKIYRRAKETKKRILFPEGEELRVLKAVHLILQHGICLPLLIGNPGRIAKICRDKGIDLKDTEIIDPGD